MTRFLGDPSNSDGVQRRLQLSLCSLWCNHASGVELSLMGRYGRQVQSEAWHAEHDAHDDEMFLQSFILLVLFLFLFSFSLLCVSLLCSSSVSLCYSNKIIGGWGGYTHYLHHQSSRTDGTNGIKGSDAPFSTQHHFDFPLGSPFLQHLAFIDGTLAPNSCWGEEKEREGPDGETPKYVNFVKTGNACKWIIHSSWNIHEDLQLTAAAL